MPRIPDVAIDGVFYLYHSVKDAKKGTNIGGCGFFVSMPTSVPEAQYIYAVSNWHNVAKHGASVIRVNTHDGGTDIFDFGPEDWVFRPKSSDVAITPPLPIKPDAHKIAAIPRRLFVDPELITDKDIGVGEDLFMVGRFVDHDGGITNIPATRYGNISVMPTPVPHPTGATELAYCIDMHSRTGFSGSPVFVYRMPGGNLNSAVKTGTTTITSGFLYLLGIHFGQFPEEWKAEHGKKKLKIDGLSGMTLVCPATEIGALLDLPKFVTGRAEDDVLAKQKHGASIIAESATTGGDEILATMLATKPQPLNRPKSPRVRRK